MKNIDEHLERDRQDLVQALANDNQGKARHLLKELADREFYKENHPGDDHDPTCVELYCERNPGSEECRIYED